MSWGKLLGVVLLTMIAGKSNAAGMRITEWMYNGVADADGAAEFVEFTNVGNSLIDMTGWRYDDNSRDYSIGFDLTGFGMVAPGESVVITDSNANVFRNRWGLDISVKILGGYTNSLGRSDEINLYDGTQALIDRLTYNDQIGPPLGPGGPRTNGISGNPISLSVLGTNDATQWVPSALGDVYGSWQAPAASGSNVHLGNPGAFTPVPEPTAFVLAAIGLVGLIAVSRRR